MRNPGYTFPLSNILSKILANPKSQRMSLMSQCLKEIKILTLSHIYNIGGPFITTYVARGLLVGSATVSHIFIHYIHVLTNT